jgi:hypothetical protein
MNNPEIVYEKIRIKLNKTDLIMNSEGVIILQGTRSMQVTYDELNQEKDNNLWELLTTICYHTSDYQEENKSGAVTAGRGKYIAELRFANGKLTYLKISKKKEQNVYIEFENYNEVLDFIKCVMKINKMKKEE